jgi:hypothetical protein
MAAPVYTSDSGDRFVMECNASGYRMTHLGSGERLFLGRSCDAVSPRLGGGSWCAANGAMGVTVGSVSLWFPRQEPSCDGGAQPFSCLCGA